MSQEEIASLKISNNVLTNKVGTVTANHQSLDSTAQKMTEDIEFLTNSITQYKHKYQELANINATLIDDKQLHDKQLATRDAVIKALRKDTADLGKTLVKIDRDFKNVIKRTDTMYIRNLRDRLNSGDDDDDSLFGVSCQHTVGV